MISEQLLALENLRFLSRSGGEPEFYDLLKGRLADLAGEWKALTLNDEERELLAASERRLECELELLRYEAAQRRNVTEVVAEPQSGELRGLAQGSEGLAT